MLALLSESRFESRTPGGTAAGIQRQKKDGLLSPLGRSGDHMRWRSWLRRGTSRRKVAGSIPKVVVGINLSVRTKAVGLAHPKTEMSTKSIS
jgi:hypothetical protein